MTMAFIPVKAVGLKSAPKACASGVSEQGPAKDHACGQSSRRRFLKALGSLSLWYAIAPLRKAHSDSILPRGLEDASSRWTRDHLCQNCLGRGLQTCDFCAGEGTITFDYALDLHKHECPNCQGVGSIRCPACIGLGLSNVKGILRDGEFLWHIPIYTDSVFLFFPFLTHIVRSSLASYKRHSLT